MYKFFLDFLIGNRLLLLNVSSILHNLIIDESQIHKEFDIFVKFRLYIF